MAWYYGTYSCGHEGRTNIVGPVKNREWISERHFEKMCPDCYKEHLENERQKANIEAAEKAVEMELPELTGTEKQVAWANTLRQTMINDFEKRFELDFEKKKELLREVLNYVLENKKNASWYIDNRGNIPIEIALEIKKEIDKVEEAKRPEVKEAIKEQKDLKTNATVRPENAKTEVVAEISIKADKISVIFEKNENFREIVKSLGYEWTGTWERKINKFNGTAEDRAAELGNKLLNAGFPIMIIDNSIRQNAVDGKYEPEQTRWIYIRTNGDYKGSLAINWNSRNERIYDAARRIKGSKYDNQSVVVKVEHYKEVEDFAKMFGFKFSDGAREAIEQHKQRFEASILVKPVIVEKQKEIDGLKDILESSEEILDDLKD